MSRTLLVARCDGPRCAGLRRLREEPGDPVRAAVRSRRDSVLVRTDCLGVCTLGAVAALGWASMQNRRLTWTDPPVIVGQVDLPAGAAELAARISDGDPASGHMGRTASGDD
jgi:hypothetical protein